MKRILLINDGSHIFAAAAKNAMIIAQKHQANILIAHTVKALKRVPVTIGQAESIFAEQDYDLNLDVYTDGSNAFVPAVSNLDASFMTVAELAEIVNKQEIWMMVRGYNPNQNVTDEISNFCSILAQVRCPLLLVPAGCEPIAFERMAYLTDLRYFQLKALRYLCKFGEPFNAHLLLAHLAAKGLPNVDQEYAKSLFEDFVQAAVSYTKIKYNNIKEKQTSKVLDVIIHGMQNELLALVYNHHHFHEATELLSNTTQTIPFLFFPS